jgi:two-component system, OmpR family, sensor histidine kinase BaeS
VTDVPRVPRHRSLIFRLLVATVTIAVFAITAASWLASQSTSRTIRQQLGQSLSDDKGVYDALLDHAATHRDWSGAQPLVTMLAGKVNRRVTLTTEDRTIILDSQAGPSLRNTRPSATIDPLSVDLALTGGDDRIDRRVLGPYRLTSDERNRLQDQLRRGRACLERDGAKVQEIRGPHDRPKLVILSPGKSTGSCTLVPPTAPTEKRPLEALRRQIAECADESGHLDEVNLPPDLSVEVQEFAGGPVDPHRTDRARECLDRSRRQQLRPYVPPPALLFVTDPADPTAQNLSPLSRANLVLTGTTTAVVLAITILVTVLVGLRLVRPLRALTEAARHPLTNPRVPVTGRDEIAYLATALNELAERREQAELLRQAMVSDVAHELRNPLTNIRSWLTAAQDGLATVDDDLLQLLTDQTAHLQHIVEDLRDLAAADAGTLQMHPEPTFVNDSVTQVLDAHRLDATRAGVHLVTDFSGDPELDVDPVRLRQLVGNLLSNAVRHTPSGGSVTVSTRVSEDRLTITVADTGTGIAAPDLDKIFERFWRADDSRNRATGGSGLGLPIARKIAEIHGGDITVISRPDTGTTFTVTLRPGH